MPQLAITAPLCAHQRVVDSDCDACVRACPRGAWHIHEQGLNFNDEACDDCGLCVAACPCEALSLPGPMPLIVADEASTSFHQPRQLLMACERAAVKAPSTGAAGFTACAQALTPEWLLRWSGDHQAGRLRLAIGDCATCDRHGDTAPGALASAWPAVAQRLRQLGQTPVAVQGIDAAEWQRLTAKQPTVDASRRRFFGRIVQGPEQTLSGKAPNALAVFTSGRRASVQAVNPTGDDPVAPLWAVRLNAAVCTWCRACERICPENVFNWDESPERSDVRVTLQLNRCTGCELCVAVCEPGALRRVPPQTGAAPKFALQRHACAACGNTYFLQHEEGKDCYDFDSNLCPVCTQGRPRQFNRIVQTAPGGGA